VGSDYQILSQGDNGFGSRVQITGLGRRRAFHVRGNFSFLVFKSNYTPSYPPSNQHNTSKTPAITQPHTEIHLATQEEVALTPIHLKSQPSLANELSGV